MDDQAYLEPAFDPSTLTIPRLRSILVAHSVSYPSSAKKQQLIDLFNEHVASQARKLKSASMRVKRTSRGIEDITTGRRGTGAGDDNDDEDDDENEVPLTPATGRSTRRSTRARTEEAQEVLPTPRALRHSTAPPDGVTPRVVSGKHARTVDPVHEEPEPERERKRTSRTPRASVATPAFKYEADEDDSPFSNDNVFQSASSPPVPRTHEPDRRRTTAGNTTARELERRNRELRRRTEGISPVKRQKDGVMVPTRKTFAVPVNSLKKEEEVEASEEFTPEEQLDLVQAQQSGELVVARRQTRRPTSNARWGVGAVLSVMTFALGTLWRQEKLQVGYCGVGSPSTDLAGVEIPPWAEPIRPQCEPCPPHAFCHELLHTECESGFVLTHHPLSLGGVIPIPPTCEPDSLRARRILNVKEKAVEELRAQNAKYECGEAPVPELKEADLKQAIATKRRKGMTSEEFEDLWESAIGEIAKADEVVSGSDGTGNATLRSTSLASLPLACAVRRSLRETLRRYFWQLIAVLFVLSSGSYGRYRITSGKQTEVKAKQLASLALEKLSLQASLHAQDPDIYRDNYIPVAQLRDDVLRDEFSASRRTKLWERVQRKVEGNANVRPVVREGRTGEVGRVWEWVGAVGYLESPSQYGFEAGNQRRKSGRVSFAPSSTVDESRLIAPSEQDRGESATRKSDHRPLTSKWTESRPYY